MFHTTEDVIKFLLDNGIVKEITDNKRIAKENIQQEIAKEPHFSRKIEPRYIVNEEEKTCEL